MMSLEQTSRANGRDCMPYMVSPSALAARPAAMKDLDASALRAIAQAAVNVELFTIPLDIRLQRPGTN